MFCFFGKTFRENVCGSRKEEKMRSPLGREINFRRREECKRKKKKKRKKEEEKEFKKESCIHIRRIGGTSTLPIDFKLLLRLLLRKRDRSL